MLIFSAWCQCPVPVSVRVQMLVLTRLLLKFENLSLMLSHIDRKWASFNVI